MCELFVVGMRVVAFPWDACVSDAVEGGIRCGVRGGLYEKSICSPHRQEVGQVSYLDPDAYSSPLGAFVESLC